MCELYLHNSMTMKLQSVKCVEENHKPWEIFERRRCLKLKRKWTRRFLCALPWLPRAFRGHLSIFASEELPCIFSAYSPGGHQAQGSKIKMKKKKWTTDTFNWKALRRWSIILPACRTRIILRQKLFVWPCFLPNFKQISSLQRRKRVADHALLLRSKGTSIVLAFLQNFLHRMGLRARTRPYRVWTPKSTKSQGRKRQQASI